MLINQAKEHARQSKEKLKKKDKDQLIDIIKALYDEIRTYDKALENAMNAEIENAKLRKQLQVQLSQNNETDELKRQVDDLKKQLEVLSHNSVSKTNRKRKATDELKKRVLKLSSAGLTIRAITTILQADGIDISRATIGRIVKENRSVS